ncbi:hypothetical protein BS78_06G018400 [Paspalum vaginatum]|nr:hypothetical protein BS78_06G018400 [Paspalum vaginatum]KAJ1269961.1 hypothetical protein BS78_06G018400 [Paspalum vaginatum]
MSLEGENMYIKFQTLEAITNNFAGDREVGRGGYGVVYRAVYEGQQIAVKKLHQLLGLDDSAFDNEFRNLFRIDHPNIVRFIGYCHESQRKFIPHNGKLITATEMERVLCFEYVEGGSLEKHISGKSCDLDWPTCYGIIKGVCVGLNHLHSARGKPIYHLDLKPANILLDKKFTAKIGDLGLSRLVSSTLTRKTEACRGTFGYMPPEYVKDGDISKKFDVFSLGAIIIKIMDGNNGNSRRHEMTSEQFIELVIGNWKEKMPGKPVYPSQETGMLQVKTCIKMALTCVEDDRNRRPLIKDIVHELEELDAKVQEMLLLCSEQSIGPTGLPGSSDSNIVAVDPSLELRFPFELRKDLSCCLQLTNKTDGYIAFNIKTNPSKYYAEPNRGIMPPCSKRYVCVTLKAQEEAPPNMQCHDVFLVESVHVSRGHQTSEEITEDFFEKAMAEKKVVDVVKLPIVYVARDQLSRY